MDPWNLHPLHNNQPVRNVIFFREQIGLCNFITSLGGLENDPNYIWLGEINLASFNI